MSNLNIPPPIAVVVRSPRWHSQIQRFAQRLDPAPKVHWMPDFDSVATFALENHEAVLIAELPDSFANNPEQTLGLVTGLCNNPQQCPLFLLGDESIESWHNVLAEAGAVETCCSILDFEKVCLQVQRHLENHAIGNLSVEEAVAARLPW